MPGVPVCQVTLAVTLICCPPACQVAVKQSFPVAIELAGRLKEVIPFGPRTTLVTFAKVTVAVVVALAGPEAAVRVLVPAATGVSRPPVLSVATVGSEVDQHTVVPEQLVPALRVIEFPLLSVPAAVNCRGDPPTLTVGLGGSITRLETVGFWKKPVQLMVRANIRSRATEPAKRPVCLDRNIIVKTPSARLLRPKPYRDYFAQPISPSRLPANLPVCPAACGTADVTRYVSTIRLLTRDGCKKL